MRYEQVSAVLDLGSNSFKMLVGRVVEGRLEILDDFLQITGMRKRMDERQEITGYGIEVMLSAIDEFLSQARLMNVTKIVAAGTAVLREARNQDAVLHRIQAETGLKVRVLSGEEEAEYSFIGAGLGLSGEPSEERLVFDVGGGSTELILGKGTRMLKRTSLPIGAASARLQFFQADPPRAEEVRQLEDYVGGLVSGFLEGQKPERGIGVGGTVTSLGSIHLEIERYDRQRVHGLKLSGEQIATMTQRLLDLPLQQRRELRGLHPERADVMHAGSVIVRTIQRAAGLDEIAVSDYGLRHAILWQNGINDHHREG